MHPFPDAGGLTVAAALLAGLGSGLHCFAMCGPLACAGCAGARSGGRAAAVTSYQGARLGAYIILGGLVGTAGHHGMRALSLASPRWLPWALAALLLASALGLGRFAPRVPGLSGIVHMAARAGAALRPAARSALLGAVTPLLPCGLVWALFASALVTGSFGSGALLAGGFALGSAPALLAAQLQTAWMGRLPRGSEFVLRRAVPVIAAVALVWRALAAPATAAAGVPPPCH